MSCLQNGRQLLALTVTVLLVFGAAGSLWAVYANYSRFSPLMDYVPQEMGFYDTTYWQLEDNDCRRCHGDSVAERHHATETALATGQCDPCHLDEDGPPPSGVGPVIRSCTTSSCHSWEDLMVNGWHHARAQRCIDCHNPNLVDEISPFRDFETDPPMALDPNLIPNPFSCDNCHWEQANSPAGDPDHPAHPSTYDHYDDEDRLAGFHEYSKPIHASFDTHHMGYRGPIGTRCATCHSKDPNEASWDPYNQELIRYCEICHSVASLHSIGPHVKDSPGWEAVGFHVSGNMNPEDTDPLVYRTWLPLGPYLPEVGPGFAADEACLGCHWGALPERPEAPPMSPVIDVTTAGIEPNHACCGTTVTLRGEFFGEEFGAGYRVQVQRNGGFRWYDMPVYLWADTLIEFEVPCWTLPLGNYRVRVMTPQGTSNVRVFTLETISRSPASGSPPADLRFNLDGGGCFIAAAA